MEVVVRDSYGEADRLRVDEIERPEIGDGDVLVRVRAAGVGREVSRLMTGVPYPVRLAGYGLRAPKDRALGRDLSGVVAAAGSDITTLRPGDEVFGISEGSFAEYARARADELAPKPRSLTVEQAAAVPVSGLAALQAVRDHTQVSRASGCWSSAPREASERSRCRSPKRLALR